MLLAFSFMDLANAIVDSDTWTWFVHDVLGVENNLEHIRHPNGN